jgi:hypothetical protein
MQKPFTYGFAAAAGVVSFFVLKEVDYRSLVSICAEWLSIDPTNVSDLSRDAFSATEVPEVKITPGHTHPAAAGFRTAATNCAKNVAAHMGTGLYVRAMSKNDQRRGMRGDRQWYWSKDTNVENRRDSKRDDDLILIVDTDYYLDMPEVLARDPKPTLLYTCVPGSATTHGEDDTSTYFNECGELVTLVSGGGTFCHYLWDYAGDSIIVTRKFLGITYKTVTYAVERKQISDHRQLILLAPIKIFYGLGAHLALFMLEGKRLQRFQPLVQASDGTSFIRFLVHRSDGTQVTTARPCTLLCATVPAHVDDAVATVARLGTTNLMLPTVSSWLEKGDRPAAAVLTEYHRLVAPQKVPVVYPVNRGVRAYQYEPRQYDQEAKPKLQAFMSPLVHGAFAPVGNDAGERQCVYGRITSLRMPEPHYHQFTMQCMIEFAVLVSQGVRLEPVPYEVVEAKQTSASQQLSLRKAVLAGHYLLRILKCFIKSEAYKNISDPRNISTFQDRQKLEMAQYSLAMSEHCKRFAWYGPGKTPKQIATRVAELALTADFLNVSDCFRLDGTITHKLRQVDRRCFMISFPEHRAGLNETLKNTANNKGYLPNGTTFDQGPSQGSGCSGTSCVQTLRTTFVSYLGYRHTSYNGRTYDAEEAFAKIGTHTGDDGVDPDLSAESHEWAAAKVGVTLKIDLVQRGDVGVNYLSRYYSAEVWEGRPDSMSDVKRQLSKFHTTVRLPDNVKPEQKLVEKAMAYVATDPNTPVLGELCQRVLTISEYRPVTPLGVGTWWSKFESSEQYPNSNDGGWMDVEFDRLFPEFDRSIFNNWMATAKTVPQILAAPLCAEPVVPIAGTADVVVDGETILDGESVAPKEEKKDDDEGESSNGGMGSVKAKSRKKLWKPKTKEQKSKL